jgi:hypothetical protein
MLSIVSRHLQESPFQQPDQGNPVAERSDVSVGRPKNDGIERLSGVPGRATRCKPPGPFMAATYGRLSGRPGICISALGPGAQNFCFVSKVLF